MHDIDQNLRAAIEASGSEEYAPLREAIKATEPAKRMRGETPHIMHIDEMPYLAHEVEIDASPTISIDELDEKHSLMDGLARNVGKIELANMLNEIAVSEGQAPTFTPEMLSAVASARIRQQQRLKRKTKKRR